MKKLIPLIAAICLLISQYGYSQILDRIKDKAKQRADSKVDKSIDKGSDKVEDEGTRKKNKTDQSQSDDKNTSVENSEQEAPSIKAYQNYDFVPGDKVLFEDNFAGEQDGEFPSHWELEKGQAVLNKINGDPSLFLTEGNYATVKPRMKTEKYLTDPFTIEFDYYPVPGAYGIVLMLTTYDKAGGYNQESMLTISTSEANFNGNLGGVNLSKSYNTDDPESFNNKWHHVAIAEKKHQIKVYFDQNRVLVIPDSKEDYDNVKFGGIGDEKSPLVFRNVRIASGGGMNMIGKKFTEAKIITHGINFDFNKATFKPESMGTLNMIVAIMKDNPDIKFEVGGHTDSDGDDNYNMKLSQQRAEAVRDQLIKMGVAADRLTAKGYGKSKPIADNNTAEGKANNRRVEFVKNVM